MALVAIGAALKIGGAIIGGARARREARRYRTQQQNLQKKLNNLISNRAEIINPYDNVTSLASMATDLSNTLSNPFANLSVATKAAEMKIEQADISLANTLDTLRATGSGAGGATALAQAALQNKKGVAAGIEQQEAGNEKLRAQGEQRLQTQIMAEKQRIQKINISEGAREQNAMAQGRAFAFRAEEARSNSDIERAESRLGIASSNAANARAREGSAISSGINALGGAISGGAFGGGASAASGFSAESQEILANAPGGAITTNTGMFSSAVDQTGFGLN
tara:strand:+ start:30 stop:872 length:843 start_codon:yes stop_codon:yes gene_type:complete